MTELLYLENTYLFESPAQILAIEDSEKGLALVLNQTIFYPQGGGQPADTGKVFNQYGLFNVTDVRIAPDSRVYHYGSFEKGEFSVGDTINLTIDKEKRMINARVHSAGHLLDCAVEQLKLQGITPTKGFHFPEGSYVEYDGTLEHDDALLMKLESTINELIAANIKSVAKNLSAEEAKQQNIWAPPGKSARIVFFEGFTACGCGGTHIATTKEIGHVSIRKIKVKKGVTRISYEVSS